MEAWIPVIRSGKLAHFSYALGNMYSHETKTKIRFLLDLKNSQMYSILFTLCKAKDITRIGKNSIIHQIPKELIIMIGKTLSIVSNT